MTSRGLLDRLEQSRGLERWGDAVRPVARAAVGEGARRDVLTGRWLGHPVHPAGVLAPMSCWFAATALDVIGGVNSRSAARRLTGAGVLAALPAAASGIGDWLDTEGAEKRVGSAHTMANGAATALYTVSWLLRRRKRYAAGVAASVAATALAGTAGLLGGHLTYRRGVGVNTVAYLAGPTEWTDVESPTPVPDETPVRLDAGGVPLVMVSPGMGRTPHVMESRCTHRGGPLHEGEVRDGCLSCPWHGSRFDLRTGSVRNGPASMPQPVYEARGCPGALSVRRAEPGSLRQNPVR